MKKGVLIIPIFILCFIFKDLSAQRVVNRILESEEIRIGTTAEQHPFSIVSKTGQIIGFDVDIATGLAEEIGVKATFVKMNFAQLLVALEKGDIDIVMSGITITTKRNLHYLFAGPYLISGKSILTKDRRLITKPISELNSGRFRIACLKGSTSETYALQNLTECKIVLADTNNDAVQMVIENEIDFMLADYSECAFASFKNQGMGLLIREELMDTERIGIALPPDDPLLHNLIQNYILQIEEDGELKKLEDKWFRSGSWLSDLE